MFIAVSALKLNPDSAIEPVDLRERGASLE